MKKSSSLSRVLSGALIAALCGLCLPLLADAQTFLRGRVEQSGAKGTGSGTTLNRHDINKNADPFSGDEDSVDQTLDAPSAAFKSERPVQPPKQQRPKFSLTAASSGNPPMAATMPQNPMSAPTDMGGTPDEIPATTATPSPPAFNPNDPDSSPDMQLAWDAWHKRVAQVIFERFNFFARAAFKHSPPLMARLSYVVTRDGQITNLNMQQKSTNVLFNVLVFQAVKSLNGDLSVLAFPQGSRRQYVPKFGTFTQNYGAEGFRYTINDKETVQGGRR